MQNFIFPEQSNYKQWTYRWICTEREDMCAVGATGKERWLGIEDDDVCTVGGTGRFKWMGIKIS